MINTLMYPLPSFPGSDESELLNSMEGGESSSGSVGKLHHILLGSLPVPKERVLH